MLPNLGSLRGAPVLVTGASGFVGTHLCRALYRHGARVVGFSRRPGRGEDHLAESLLGDMTDRARLRELIETIRPAYVVHLAGLKNSGVTLADYRESYETNLFGALNLLEACQDLGGLSRFVYLGSCEEYGHSPVPFDEAHRENPRTAYGVSKLAVTQLFQSFAGTHGFPVVVLRPTVGYGPGQDARMFLPALIQALVAGERFAMTPGEQTRDYLFIDDLVDAILRALTVPLLTAEVIQVSSGVPIRIRDLAMWAAREIGGGSEALIDVGRYDYRPGEAMSYWADNYRARAVLDWVPRVVLEEGLRQTVAYYRGVVASGNA